MDIKRAQYLLEGYHRDTLTAPELEEFTILLNDQEVAGFRNQWLDGYWDVDNDAWSEIPVPDSKKTLYDIQGKKPLRLFKKRRTTVMIAAIGALLILTTLVLLIRQKNSVGQPIDFEPGTYQASLIFSEGDTLSLEKGHKGIIMGDQLRYSDGKIIPGAKGRPGQNQKISVLVPAGGVYKVLLADGTEVWLNADSKLTYPLKFDEHEREVFLEGEAFFHVSKLAGRINGSLKRIPFLVKTRKQVVEVLGTQFNVSAYANERQTSTTLVEGAVKVITGTELKDGHKEILLSPGQSTVVSDDSLSLSKQVNIRATAWKEGYFDFTDMNIEQVMRQLARWYKLDIIFEGKVPDIKFYGTIDRNNRLSTILTLLETNNFGYRMSGRSLTIFFNKEKEGDPGKKE